MANLRRDRGKERFWRRHVAGWRRSGLSIRDYCRGQGLSEPSFYAWRRVLRERARQRGTGARQARMSAGAEVEVRRGVSAADKRSASATATPPVFVPVRLIEEARASSALEVVLRGGRVVRVPAGFAAAALRELVAVLEGLPC